MIQQKEEEEEARLMHDWENFPADIHGYYLNLAVQILIAAISAKLSGCRKLPAQKEHSVSKIEKMKRWVFSSRMKA